MGGYSCHRFRGGFQDLVDEGCVPVEQVQLEVGPTADMTTAAVATRILQFMSQVCTNSSELTKLYETWSVDDQRVALELRSTNQLLPNLGLVIHRITMNPQRVGIGHRQTSRGPQPLRWQERVITQRRTKAGDGTARC